MIKSLKFETKLADKNLLSLLLIAIFVGVFNIFISVRYFPLTEGWWETYAHLIELGYLPYRDVELFFTPFYIYLIKLQLTLFGSSFYLLRLFGALIYTSTIFALYLLLNKFFSKKSSLIASFVVSSLIVSQPQFIAKDYHTYYILFMVLSMSQFERFFRENFSIDCWSLLRVFMLGLTLVSLFLVKQNIGIVFFIAFAILILFNKSSFAERFGFLLLLSLSVLISFIVFSPLLKDVSFFDLILRNDSKGNLTTVLFRFLNDKGTVTLLIKSILLFLLLMMVTNVRYLIELSSKVSNLINQKITPVQRVFILLLFFAILIINRTIDYVNYHIILTTIVFLLVCLIDILWVKKNISKVPIRIVFILSSIVYCNTTTAMIDPIGSAVPIAFFLGFLIDSEYLKSKKMENVLIAVLILFTVKIHYQKINLLYSWWGLNQGSIFAAQKNFDYQQLEGLSTNKENADLFKKINLFVSKYSKTNFDTYFYNLPIFYLLESKLPPTRVITHWFDVVGTNAIATEYNKLKEIKPNLIVALEASNEAIKAHEQLKGVEFTYQEKIQNLFSEWVLNGDYILEDSIIISNVNSTNNDTSVLRVQVESGNVDNISILDVRNFINSTVNKVTILGVTKNSIFYKPRDDYLVEVGDQLTLAGSVTNLLMVTPKIGVLIADDNHYMRVNMYRRVKW